MEIPEATAKGLWFNWDRPAYATMSFEGILANSVPPWNEAILGADCVAGVRDRDQLPYIESSRQPRLEAVLDTPWARTACEQLLDAIWGVG